MQKPVGPPEFEAGVNGFALLLQGERWGWMYVASAQAEGGRRGVLRHEVLTSAGRYILRRTACRRRRSIGLWK